MATRAASRRPNRRPPEMPPGRRRGQARRPRRAPRPGGSDGRACRAWAGWAWGRTPPRRRAMPRCHAGPDAGADAESRCRNQMQNQQGGRMAGWPGCPGWVAAAADLGAAHNKPADFHTPEGGVTAFLDALKARDLDRLTEATAIHAQVEARPGIRRSSRGSTTAASPSKNSMTWRRNSRGTRSRGITRRRARAGST